MSSSISSNNRKQSRIEYVRKLNLKLTDVNNSFETISFNIPEELESTKEWITELLELIEDLKPFDIKNFTKLKQKMLESESKINKLSTELKEIQFKGNPNQNRIKEIERELQHHNDRIKEYKLQQQSSTPQLSLNTNSSNSINKVGSVDEYQYRIKSLIKLKSNSNQLQSSITKIYSLMDRFKINVMEYFSKVKEIISKLPELRGGLDIGGVLNIGGDEAVEILERMNDYIYQSSKNIFNFIQELPNLDKNWYQYHYNTYIKIIENLENSNPNNNGASASDSNTKKIDIDILKPHKFIIDIFKKKQKNINLIEKITTRESDKIKEENANSKKLKDNNRNNVTTTPNNNNKKENVIIIKKQQNHQQQFTNEPLSSIFYQIDAIVADIMNFMKFPDKDITSNLLIPMESKCKMLSEVLVTFQSRFQYYQEKFQVWLDYNSTILRVTSYESDPVGFEMGDLKSLNDMQAKLKILLKVMNSFLTTCPIAVPVVYLTESSWKLTSYPDFRADQRHQISELLVTIKSNHDPIDIDTLRKCTLIFTEILINVINIQIPLMIDVFEDDSTLFRTKNWSNERKSMLSTINNTIHSLKYISTTESQILIDLLNNNIKMLQQVTLKYFSYKPIGRPNVYKSDSLWKLLNDSKLRYEYRTSILI